MEEPVRNPSDLHNLDVLTNCLKAKDGEWKDIDYQEKWGHRESLSGRKVK